MIQQFCIKQLPGFILFVVTAKYFICCVSGTFVKNMSDKLLEPTINITTYQCDWRHLKNVTASIWTGKQQAMTQNFVWVKKFKDKEIQQDGSNGMCIREVYSSTLGRITDNLAAETVSPSGRTPQQHISRGHDNSHPKSFEVHRTRSSSHTFGDKQSQQLIYRYITYRPSVKDGRDEVTGGAESTVRKN